jgi:hypothetical protein
MKPWIAGLYSVIVALVPASAFAQAAPAAQPKAAPSKPEPMAAPAPARVETPQQTRAQVAPAAAKRRSRSHADARECLDRGDIVAITKCAEKFL